MHTSHPVASTSLIQRVESVTCTLDFHKLPVRPSRRFYCVGVWGPGPKRGIARHFEKLTQDR